MRFVLAAVLLFSAAAARADSAGQDDDPELYQPISVPAMTPGLDPSPAGVHWGAPDVSPASAGQVGGTSGGGAAGGAAPRGSSSGGVGGNPGAPASPGGTTGGSGGGLPPPAIAAPGALPLGPTALPSGFSAPVKSFTGRFLDSLNVPDYQCGYRTARSGLIRPSADGKRIYIQMGSGVAAYDAAAFFTQRLGQPLVTINNLAGALGFASIRTCGHFAENYLPWDKFSYFESPKSGFRYLDSGMDGQDRLPAYDVDDRGDVYSATMVYGWGIAHDDGNDDGALMSFVSQVDAYSPDLKNLDVTAVFAVKSAGKYFAVVGGQSSRRAGVWDVTNAEKPSFLGVRAIPMPTVIAHNAAGDRLAFVDSSAGGKLEVYTADAYLNEGAPLFAVSPQAGRYFAGGVATDGVNFYAAEPGPNLPLRLHTLSPKGGAYSDAPADTTEVFSPFFVDYGAGLLTVSGRGNVRMYKAASPAAFENVGGDFLHGYYAKTGDAKVSVTAALPYSRADGSVYLIVSADDLADVYQLNSGTGTTAGVALAASAAAPAAAPSTRAAASAARTSGTTSTQASVRALPGPAPASASALSNGGRPVRPESRPLPPEPTTAAGGAPDAASASPSKAAAPSTLSAAARPALLKNSAAAPPEATPQQQLLLGRITRLSYELGSGTLTPEQTAAKTAELKKAESDYSLAVLRGDVTPGQ